MFLWQFFLSLSFAMAAPSPLNKVSVWLDSNTAKSPGGAYILHSLSLNDQDIFLESSPGNIVDSIYWYPSGKVVAHAKNGKKFLLGNSEQLSGKAEIANLYFNNKYRVQIKKDAGKGFWLKSQQHAVQLRNVTTKAILKTPEGEIFLESLATQVKDGNDWVTP